MTHPGAPTRRFLTAARAARYLVIGACLPGCGPATIEDGERGGETFRDGGLALDTRAREAEDGMATSDIRDAPDHEAHTEADATPPPAADIVLVNFGCSEQETTFGHPSWKTLLRHPTLTTFVDPDGTGQNCGLTETGGPGPDQTYMGVAGSVPITMKRGQRIVAVFYNANAPSYWMLGARVSFGDLDGPSGATTSTPWHRMYSESAEGPYLPRGSSGELTFNINTAESLVCPGAQPTVGGHTAVNISMYHTNSAPGAFVLKRIELRSDADLTSPEAPTDLTATAATVTAEAPGSAIKLAWSPSVDSPGTSNRATGVSRYAIYRDGEFFDMVNRDWTYQFAGAPHAYDLEAAPGSTHTYAVRALDRAVTGYNPTAQTLGTRRSSNEGDAASVQATAPTFPTCALLSPHEDLQYAGAFALPNTGGFEYGGQGLTYYPGGNPGAAARGELPGSLYVLGHDHELRVAEIAIPNPVLTKDLSALPIPRTLRPLTDLWPRYYGGNWVPGGSVQVRAGLSYHPGHNGVGEGLYYGIFMSYSGDVRAPVHGRFSLDLSTADGPWHVGALPQQPGHVPFTFTGKFLAAIPQAFADAHTGGRSLLLGLGWPISGHGWPSCGPALHAVAPWESGDLPPAGGVLSEVPLLRYGTTNQMAHWQTNWTQNTGNNGVAWVEAGQASAVVFTAIRPRGEEWYGGDNGYESVLCDGYVPNAQGPSMQRGQAATDYVPMLQLYNPRDFGRVVAGDLSPWQPQPYAAFPMRPYFISQTKGFSFSTIRSVAYDKLHRRLFVYEDGVGALGQGAIHVFNVNVRSQCL